MAILNTNDISKMAEKERKEKLEDLRMELVKSKVSANKTGKMKIKEIKKTIARLLTFNRLNRPSEAPKVSETKKPVKSEKVSKESVDK